VTGLLSLVRDKRIIVCVGAGGVGKTTTAAALAMKAAALGRRAIVCTIDPAHRLANAMGMESLGNRETRIAPERLSAAGLELPGALYAMMLDVKRTWDDLILKNTSPEHAQAILANRFYQQLSTALAGSHEYIAMEKLVDLRLNREYDLLVLDTPPPGHALDFLDAPHRVLDVLGNARIRWLLAPALKAGQAGLKMFNLTGGYFVKTLSRLTGMALLEDLARFLAALAPMYGTFQERASMVKRLLASSETAFVVVSSASPLTVDEAVSFHTLLVQDGMPVEAVVANRVSLDLQGPEELGAGSLAHLAVQVAGPGVDPRPTRERLERAMRDAKRLSERDERELQRLAAGCAPTPVTWVPLREGEVHDLAGLARLDRFLFGEETSGQRVEVR